MGDVLAGKALNINGAGPLRSYLRTKNVLDGQIDIEDILSMPMTDAEFERFRILSGDVLLNEGQTLELVGRCSVYHDEFGAPCAMQNQLLRFRAHDATSPEFAEHLFRHCQQTGKFATIATQTTSVAHLGSSRFSRLDLPWPTDRDEQRAVAGALTDVDDLIATLQRLITKKQAIKQGMMQQLLTGKTRLPGFTEPWHRAMMGDIATVSRGASPRPIASPRWFSDSSPVGWVRITDLSRSDGLTLTSTTQRLSPDGIARSRFVPAGTLIMSIAATVGLPIVTGIDACIHDGFVAIERLKGVNQTYLLYVLKSLEAELRSSGQTGSQVNVNTTIVKELSIWLPSVDEQHQIGGALRDIDTELSKIQLRLGKFKHVKQGMMQQLLTGRTRLPVPEQSG